MLAPEAASGCCDQQPSVPFKLGTWVAAAVTILGIKGPSQAS